MRSDIISAKLMNDMFLVHPSILQSLESYLNDGMPDMKNEMSTANNSVNLETINGIAVISIDGAMYRKDMSGMCMSVASYESILKKIDKVEEMYENKEITDTLFRVTTPGGTAAQVDLVEERISNMKMPTHTLFEIMGASAGIYAFMASDNVYASKRTELGSIGAVSELILREPKDGEKVLTFVSKRAKNKRMDLDSDEARAKIESKLDALEQDFYDVVTKNTGFTEEKIEKVFNSGDTIDSSVALKEGFIDGVISFNELINKISNNMGGNTTAIPSLSEKLANSNQGENMEFTQKNFDTLLEQNKVFSANRETMSARLETATAKVENLTAGLEAKEEEVNQLNSKLAEATANAESHKTSVKEAFSMGVASEETILAMMNAENGEDASKIALNAKEDDSINQGDLKHNNKSPWANIE